MNGHSFQYLVDTDWVINYFLDIEGYQARFDEIGYEQLGISIITQAELYEGMFYARDPQRALSQLDACLERGIAVVDLNDSIIRIFGRERGRLRRGGNMIPNFDLLIASTALHYSVPLCTNNIRHFERIDGLRLVSFHKP
ncbi:MAG: type II toxin-antitoxin system VapC family toxin [Candidatus Poribacteria bacterium]|nr:type II toxin-antitoxin system VapC family toxin [Candidatus Poribacteria bacterium]